MIVHGVFGLITCLIRGTTGFLQCQGRLGCNVMVPLINI
jgi:hypothetical protein